MSLVCHEVRRNETRRDELLNRGLPWSSGLQAEPTPVQRARHRYCILLLFPKAIARLVQTPLPELAHAPSRGVNEHTADARQVEPATPPPTAPFRRPRLTGDGYTTRTLTTTRPLRPASPSRVASNATRCTHTVSSRDHSRASAKSLVCIERARQKRAIGTSIPVAWITTPTNPMALATNASDELDSPVANASLNRPHAPLPATPVLHGNGHFLQRILHLSSPITQRDPCLSKVRCA